MGDSKPGTPDSPKLLPIERSQAASTRRYSLQPHNQTKARTNWNRVFLKTRSVAIMTDCLRDRRGENKSGMSDELLLSLANLQSEDIESRPSLTDYQRDSHHPSISDMQKSLDDLSKKRMPTLNEKEKKQLT
ncbi:uncharacterized protein LOC111699359 [Eurytemora carolleeae]|uniref:uncharacterized protein LOC111699359 n=1 Tax=Eurytemora carolleeae TaxID=1294199 RepID=UPI000C77816F|nr:uncharacterized protein LOC111699359 [Eurytemora carolleeae]|eukprot:XP_023325781.1 uncharacterized protein LOC111699359 [Eurytemora affinis]